MEIIYSPEAIDDIAFWKISGNKKVKNRISELLLSIEEDPYKGIGKPEALKYGMTGCWSRRITKEHRLVYRMHDKDTVEIISLRFHYDR